MVVCTGKYFFQYILVILSQLFSISAQSEMWLQMCLLNINIEKYFYLWEPTFTVFVEQPINKFKNFRLTNQQLIFKVLSYLNC